MGNIEAAVISAGLNVEGLNRLCDAAFYEDLNDVGDITSDLLIDASTTSVAQVLANASGVFAGGPVVAFVAQYVDPSVSVEVFLVDGQEVKPGLVIAELSGNTRSLLKLERVLLNLLSRLSGIATLTNHYVNAVAGTKTKIRDTRKTTPGLRDLEKYAVRCGGGLNHRAGLYDGVLVKDNHLKEVGGVAGAAKAISGSKLSSEIEIEIEVDNLAQLSEALDAKLSLILLDNFTVAELREAVAVAKSKSPAVMLEASGGITLENVKSVAETGVDFIAVGALTHGAGSLDIHIEFE